MCGRYVIKSLPQTIIDAFEAVLPPLPPYFPQESLFPRMNIAPTESVPAICAEGGVRRMQNLRWGLIPGWAKDAKAKPQPFNVRAESIEERAMFRGPFERRRCLMPADGFYEWKATGTKTKQPYFIRRRDLALFAFAGIWDTWSNGLSPIDSCALITTRPNRLMETIHDRMPVILRREDYGAWLNPQTPTEVLRSLLVPCSAEELEAATIDLPPRPAERSDAPTLF